MMGEDVGNEVGSASDPFWLMHFDGFEVESLRYDESKDD
jgi:hypothetical protein